MNAQRLRFGKDLGQVIEEYLSAITLEDIVNKARIKGGNDYVI